ncbi:MAG TPA: hypothetical protein VE268_03395, partial [Herpetosiphonaceae bacterium]|nr:hypothetical protein [Herpetosiphonaceae bacterium]
PIGARAAVAIYLSCPQPVRLGKLVNVGRPLSSFYADSPPVLRPPRSPPSLPNMQPFRDLHTNIQVTPAG